MTTNQPNSKRPFRDTWWHDQQPWALLDVLTERAGKTFELYWSGEFQQWWLIVDGDDVYRNQDSEPVVFEFDERDENGYPAHIPRLDRRIVNFAEGR